MKQNLKKHKSDSLKQLLDQISINQQESKRLVEQAELAGKQEVQDIFLM